jgi:hypothetical protein
LPEDPREEIAANVSIHTFKSGRQLACWLGLTPRESSSGGRRRLGAISKQGDPYLRMLLIHGARSALNGATRTANADKPVSQLQSWALERASAAHRNKAVVALANKMARIVWAVWRHERVFDGNHAEQLLPDRHCERNRILIRRSSPRHAVAFSATMAEAVGPPIGMKPVTDLVFETVHLYGSPCANIHVGPRGRIYDCSRSSSRHGAAQTGRGTGTRR